MKLKLFDHDGRQTLLELCVTQQMSAPLFQSAQLTLCIHDLFSSCSRIALRNEGSNWITECRLWFSHLCHVQPKFWEFCMSFHFSHNHLNTWVNHRFLKYFHTRFILVFEKDSQTDKRWNGACCGTFPFTTRRSRSITDMVSTNQDWKCVCVLLCQENVIKSYNWGCSFSFFFLQWFNLKMFFVQRSLTQTTHQTPVNSMSTIFEFLFFSTRRILREHCM